MAKGKTEVSEAGAGGWGVWPCRTSSFEKSGKAKTETGFRGDRKEDIRLHGEGNSKLPWRKAGQPRHLVDVVDSDQ